jgi:predicted Zn-dependent protease with MMP-like domain
MIVQMEKEEFENLVYQSLEDIPQMFKEKLENIDIVIESWPSRGSNNGQLLLGLYQGVPKTVRGQGYHLALPDKITIFQGPIEYVSGGDPESIKSLVVNTVQHEIAHHFGISDRRLRELGR